MNKHASHRARERGIALLFALGILSLLMVLGLAFVTNSVISQKIAFNNSTRSQAKVIAAGAINRVAGAVMLYQYQLGSLRKDNTGTTGIGDILVTDLSTEVSHAAYDSSSTLKIADDADSSRTTLDDQLADELPAYQRILFDASKAPKSEVASTDDDFYANKETSSQDPLRKPTWVLIDNGKTGDELRIIGRYAYRVLPPRSNSRINLADVMNFKTPGSSDPLFVSLNEVPLDNVPPLSFWTVVPSPVVGSLVPSLDIFLQAWNSEWASGNTTAYTKWVKRWFDDGEWPGDLEVFESAVDNGSGKLLRRFYHRFNVNRSDWGGASGTSLNGKALNSEDAVEELLSEPKEFRHDASTFDVTNKNATSPLDSGLRYLNMIGTSVSGFSDLGYLRKQVAANLIDYCDTDSIPTSRVPAAKWKDNLNSTTIDDNDTGWPKYTGNEKTPYINEFALMFDVVPEIVGANTSSMQIKLTITPTVLAELIDIYELKPTDTYKLYLNLKEIKIMVNITGKGDYSIPGTPPTTGSFDKSESKTFTFTPPAPIEIVFDNSAWKSDGYAVAGTALTAIPQTLDLALPAGVTSVTNVKTSFKIASGTSFTVKGIALMDKDASGSDFVRWNETVSSAATSLPEKMLFTAKAGSTGVFTLASSSDSFGLSPQDQKLLIAGMQAKDPRQNLNVSTTAASSDWSDLSAINWVEYDSSLASPGYDTTTLLTMNLDLTKAALVDQIVKGLVNKDANPTGKSSAGTVAAGTLGDVETAIDPAWLGDAVDKHLSTAYIRNAPMLSLWELGAIHRGALWQTINLKHVAAPGTAGASSDGDPFLPEDHMDSQWGKDSVIAGTSYYDGDGAILDQVKLTDKARSYGKLDWNMFKTESGAFPTADNSHWLSTLLKAADASWRGDYSLTSGTPYTNLDTDIIANVGAMTNDLIARSEVLRQKNSSGNKVLFPPGAVNDREQEEVAGKLMNLMKAGPGLVTTFQAVIIAQTIRDVDGVVYRLDANGTQVGPHTAKYGTFDLDSGKDVYFDDITGEAKLLVTFDRNPSNGKIKVRTIELLDVKNYNARMQ